MTVELKKSDCEAINAEIVESVKPKMPEMSVGDLAVLLNMTKSAVSHQLKVLKTAKLVRSQKKGKNVYYTLSDEHVKTLLEMALEHVCE